MDHVTVLIEDPARASALVEAGFAVARAAAARLDVVWHAAAPGTASDVSSGTGTGMGDASTTRQAALTAAARERIDLRWVQPADAQPDASLEPVRDADLLVIGRPAPDDEDALDRLERLLVRAARPTLVLPADRPVPLAGTAVLVAWDGSPAARRAVDAAAPWLGHAGEVVCAYVERYAHDEGAADSMVSLAAALSVGGRRVRTLRVAGVEVPQAAGAICDLAGHAAAGLVVMGAFGHPRLQERWFGGVTREMLRRCDRPLLLCH